MAEEAPLHRLVREGIVYSLFIKQQSNADGTASLVFSLIQESSRQSYKHVYSVPEGIELNRIETVARNANWSIQSISDDGLIQITSENFITDIILGPETLDSSQKNSNRLHILENAHTLFCSEYTIANLPQNTWKTVISGSIDGPGTFLVVFSGMAYTSTAWLRYRVQLGDTSANGESGTWQPTHASNWHSTVVRQVVHIEGTEKMELALQYMSMTTTLITSVKDCIISVHKIK
mmetsp:Transcript_3016/g.3379  ORF Transcript_3016/g.3379 Transcript_3016/m.3379 type:complete len:234 (+) Transcript_3016:3-704(+)